VTRQRGFAAVALDAALLTPASADPHHGGFVFGLAALGAAAVVGVVTIVTAAVLVSAPFYAPGPASYPPAPLMVAEARHFPRLPRLSYAKAAGQRWSGRSPSCSSARRAPAG